MKELKMPASYIAMDEQEQYNTEGGFFFDIIFSFFTPFFKGLRLNFWDKESATETQSRGYISTVGNTVLTGSDSYTHTVETGSSATVNFGHRRPWRWRW